ncbi:MAG: transcriptional repressor [Candidatus Neomarinimicrobiota bacterium]
MRYSRQREEILNIVRLNPVHPTADWVYEQARKSIPNISLGTVYRNLNQLVQNRQVRAVKFEGCVHYDGNLHDHVHFTCSECQNIFDVQHSIDDLLNQFSPNCDHLITGGRLELTGICKNCQTLN